MFGTDFEDTCIVLGLASYIDFLGLPIGIGIARVDIAMLVSPTLLKGF